MIGVVLDTNVVVSANLNDEGLEAFVVSLALERQVRLYVSAPILAEYEQVLRYSRLKFLPREIRRFLDFSGNLHADPPLIEKRASVTPPPR